MSSGSITGFRTWVMRKDAAGASALYEAELPPPALAAGDALVEVAGCGICGTDIGFFYDGVPTVSAPPLTLGHEVSGTVVRGSPGLVGKRVVVPTLVPCRRCTLCASGRTNRCLSQRMLGNSYGPYGGFATHVAVPERELCQVPDDARLPIERLAVVADAVATPYQACRRAGVGEGAKVIVVGAAGGLGVYATQWARHLGAALVVGIGRDAARLAVMEAYGLDLALSTEGADAAALRHEIWRHCRSRRIDPKHSWTILEMTGTRAGQALALELLTYASKAVLVGYSTAAFAYQLSRLMAYDAELIGTWGCGPEHYPFVLSRVLSGAIEVLPFTETRPMEAIRESFEEVRAGRRSVRRLVLTPSRGQAVSAQPAGQDG